MAPPAAARSRALDVEAALRLPACARCRRARCFRPRRSADRAASSSVRACARRRDSRCRRCLRRDRRPAPRRDRGARCERRGRRSRSSRCRFFARRDHVSRYRSRKIRRRDRLVARRHDFDANAAPVDAVRNDPERIRAILRRGFAAVGGFLFESDDADALTVRADRLDDLLDSRFGRAAPSAARRRTRPCNAPVRESRACQASRIAYYKDLVPSKNGGRASCERFHADLATSDQQDEPQG